MAVGSVLRSSLAILCDHLTTMFVNFNIKLKFQKLIGHQFTANIRVVREGVKSRKRVMSATD
jgi:hypothetical protein